MSKHTPGPWLIHGAMLGYKGDILSPTAKRIPDCHHIARCFAPKPESDAICELQAIGIEREAIAQIEANARLIASAPDLLEALQWIAKNYENGHINHVDFRVEAKHLADAAIAKALGEQA